MRAMLDELLRVRAVELLDDGRIRLLTRSYVPAGGEIDKLGILGTDVADLIATIDRNLRCPPAAAYFQRQVQYDNLPSEVMPELRTLSRQRAQNLIEQLAGSKASIRISTVWSSLAKTSLLTTGRDLAWRD
jgi:hypothetical protein